MDTLTVVHQQRANFVDEREIMTKQIVPIYRTATETTAGST